MVLSTSPNIPYDMYESPQEIVIIMPLWGVRKESLHIKIEDYRILIQWERVNLGLKSSLVAVQEECYWGKIEQRIEIPAQVYFDRIHSKLTSENILQIIIPKAFIPSHIELELEE